jgi:hypothetical protein
MGAVLARGLTENVPDALNMNADGFFVQPDGAILVDGVVVGRTNNPEEVARRVSTKSPRSL